MWNSLSTLREDTIKEMTLNVGKKRNILAIYKKEEIIEIDNENDIRS